MKEHHSHFCYTELGTIDTKYHLLIFLQMTMAMTKNVLWPSYDYTELLTADTYHLLILSEWTFIPSSSSSTSKVIIIIIISIIIITYVLVFLIITIKIVSIIDDSSYPSSERKTTSFTAAKDNNNDDNGDDHQ